MHSAKSNAAVSAVSPVSTGYLGGLPRPRRRRLARHSCAPVDIGGVIRAGDQAGPEQQRNRQKTSSRDPHDDATTDDEHDTSGGSLFDP